MLLKTVADQKIFVASLEKTMADQTMELEECKQLVVSEIDKKNELENEIQKLNAENTKLKMTNHNFEQELRRLESVVQSMMIINPKQMEHLQKMQPDFKFKERNIAISEPQGLLQTSAAPPVANSVESSTVIDGKENGTKDKEILSNHEAANLNSLNAKIGPLLSEENSVVGGVPVAGKTSNNQNLFGTALNDALIAGNTPAESALTIDTKPEDKQQTKTDLSPLLSPVEGEAPVPPADVAPSMTPEEERLLERVRWIIKRYRAAWPDNQPFDIAELTAGNPITVPSETAKDENNNNYNNNNSNMVSASKDSMMSFSSTVPDGMGNRLQSFSGQKLRNSLLRGSNPFLKVELNFGSPTRSGEIPPSPMNKTHGMSSFRTSFSRNLSLTQAMAAAVQAVENSPGPGGGGGGAANMPNPYYSDSELEGIVILWAKVLFTVLEFMETGKNSLSVLSFLFSFLSFFLSLGDITNLPKEDKRLWAEHLLEQSRRVSDIPYEVLEEHDREQEQRERLLDEMESQKNEDMIGDNGSLVSSDTQKISRALFNTTMITVDQVQPNTGKTVGILSQTQQQLQQQNEQITWREGLLRLRTMFPGAGNFSGFGVGIEAPQDTALFQRLLDMREDLKKIENVQQLRYQQHFLDSQRLKESQTKREELINSVTTPTGKRISSFNPNSLKKNRRKESTTEGMSFSEKEEPTETDLGEGSLAFSEDNNSLHLSRPLGVNVYAGNLKKTLRPSSKDKH
jgi:hypothetical protein